MRYLSCLLCLFSLTVYGQNTTYYSNGKTNHAELKNLMNAKGYQAVSDFDTVSIDPLLIYAIYFKNNKMGLLSHAGKEITPAIYQSFPGLESGSNQFSYHKHWTVKRDGKYGMVNQNGKEVVPAKFISITYIQSVNEQTGWYVDEYYLAQVSDEVMITINTLGKMGKIPDEAGYDEANDDIVEWAPHQELDYPEEKDELSYPDYGQVWDNAAHPHVVYKNRTLNKYGLMNVLTGDTVIPFIYDGMSLNYKKEVLLTLWDTSIKDEKYRAIVKPGQGLADIRGNILFEPVYLSIYRFNEVYQVVNMSGKMALFSEMRQIPLSGFIYGPKMGNGNGTYMELQKGEKWGLVNMIGTEVTTFEYDGFSFPEDHDLPAPIIIVRKESKVAIMDYATNKFLTPFIYSLIIPECNVESGGFGAISEAFNFISNQRNLYYFVAIGTEYDSWRPGKTKYGIMDTNFVERIPCQFDAMVKCDERSLVIVNKDDLWGILNVISNEYLVPLSLSSRPEEVNYSYFLYPKEGKYGMIDYDGNVVIPFVEEQPFRREYYYNGLTRVYRYDGYAAYYDGMGNRVEVSE